MTQHNAERPVFRQITIIGIGLIGSSIALAAKAFGAVDTVKIWDKSPKIRAEASGLKLGQVVETEAEAVADADLVILCPPVGAIKAAAESCAPFMKAGAILSDVGSVKGKPALDMLNAASDSILVIPGHPIAGTEQSGPSAGFAELFQNRWCILTPQDEQSEDYAAGLARLDAFWTQLGSNVQVMTPRHHDMVLSITSHLPHLIAFNIVATAGDLEEVTDSEVVKFSAGGFRDFTRIAASDPTMWRDVFLNNKEAVLESLGRFSEDLAALQRAIRWNDGETLHALFTRARGIRRSIIEAGQDTAEADFGRSPASPEAKPADDVNSSANGAKPIRKPPIPVNDTVPTPAVKKN